MKTGGKKCGGFPKVMPLLLLCWLKTSETDVDGMTVRLNLPTNIPLHFVGLWQIAEERHWQNIIWHGSAYEVNVWNWTPLCRETSIYWHSSTLVKFLWKPNGCEHREAEGDVFQQWQQQKWASFTGADLVAYADMVA